MKFRAVVVACVVLLNLAGCSGRAPLNPPQLVTANETDMAIQLFMQATILMAKYYGFDTIEYGEIAERSQRAGFQTIPFMAPVTSRATPPFVTASLKQRVYDHSTLTGDGESKKFREWVGTMGGYPVLLRYYVTTGWRAAQIVCRNYLLDLDERNQYFEFLQKELGISFGLSSTILALASANGTLRSALAISQTAVNDGINAYQDYRFLPIVDREAARELVEAAQNQYAMDFLKNIGGSTNGNIVPSPNIVPAGDSSYFLFSDAIHVMNTIEYQCTRSGVRNLVAIALRGATPKLKVDNSTTKALTIAE
jgi:hypothetical protein